MPVGTIATVDLVARLALLALSSFGRIVAEKSALEGKSEGQILRETLKGLDETDAALVKTLLKAHAKKAGVNPTQAISENLIEMGELLPVLQRALTAPPALPTTATSA